VLKHGSAVLLAALALAGCGGGGLKSAADDIVRGTGYEVQSVTKTGDDAGKAVVEDPSGKKATIDLVKVQESGKFVFDRCQDASDTEYDCLDALNR